jgi:hypothetical protein
MGIINVETRLSEQRIPADPANVDSREVIQQQAGQVGDRYFVHGYSFWRYSILCMLQCCCTCTDFSVHKHVVAACITLQTSHMCARSVCTHTVCYAA